MLFVCKHLRWDFDWPNGSTLQILNTIIKNRKLRNKTGFASSWIIKDTFLERKLIFETADVPALFGSLLEETVTSVFFFHFSFLIVGAPFFLLTRLCVDGGQCTLVSERSLNFQIRKFRV